MARGVIDGQHLATHLRPGCQIAKRKDGCAIAHDAQKGQAEAKPLEQKPPTRCQSDEDAKVEQQNWNQFGHAQLAEDDDNITPRNIAYGKPNQPEAESNKQDLRG